MKFTGIMILVYMLLLAAPSAIGQNSDDKIAFYSLRSGRDDIYLMNADGSNVQLLTRGKYGGKCPDFSPDGKQIVFVSLRDGNSEIYMLDLISGNEHRLTDLPSVERQPEWSPDGSRIALQSNRDGNWEIYIINSDGSNLRRLTDTDVNETNVA